MGGHCLWDGMLSPNDFIASADDLAKKWKAINPNLPQWAWIPCQRMGVSCNAEGYLALENMNQLSASEALTDDENYSAEEEPFDNATLVQSYNDDMHIYDFHIVYSFSYRVPVLYFRGYRCDGHPLLLCDIERDLPPYSLKIQNESKWTFMTQEEHPYLRRPWYTLHPCGTSDWMKLLLGGDLPSKSPDMLHYLSAWLSVVGQTVGLRIPLELHDKSI
ncbi:ubiquitin-like-conjugating enzyme ATG10 isoform X2 [Phoenix dactylifera]|uniref:Ubiquitin-like-conjugating enzyme ATG10 n=1 Tax=Phoenix dactylifera TaxID=42345 RepID=A0A8B7CKN8_PHODC|nr:ubiquitin-like-conjugating enzyme ATG10 isoform X2 [Phoenix dactylifera]